MAQDEISTWLRASAENKITTKNTWRATLIEHFSDISSFREQQGMNFKKAGCALEGCVKVYSTRVDDVTENTSKLLGLFGKEEDSKRKTGKRRKDFIEKNHCNIDLKETQSVQFYDPIFSSILTRTDEIFLVNMLSQTNEGMFLYENKGDTIIYEDATAEFVFNALPICASLKEIKEIENIDSIPAPEEYKHEEECFEPEGFPTEDIGNDEYEIGMGDNNEVGGYGLETQMSSNKTGKQVVYEETPFGYFKGWAGPGHWKLSSSTPCAADKPRKPKVTHFIDFQENEEYAFLFEKANTTMSKEQILERRRNKNLMPEDYSYGRTDLYKYLVRDGCFTNKWNKEDNGVTGNEDQLVEFQEPDNDPGDFEGEAVGDEVDLSFRLENSLVLEEKTPAISMKIPKAPKKVDIKKLKENVQKLMQEEDQSLCSVYKGIPELYSSKEIKDISFHMCFISLLHLANENSYELSLKNNDICIKR
ncbi:condensin complex subunit 2 [Pancytospora epiphaga]|nr:condensin complex subunit 2 [Pancytospora epiphaga]